MGKKKRFQKEWDYQPGKYYVKGIIDYRNRNGTEEYLVWWEGYGEDEATWEPKYNIARASKDADWHQTLRDCEEKAEQRNQSNASKTKLIKHTPEKGKTTCSRTKQEDKLNTACSKLADYLLRYKDNLNQFFEVPDGSIEQQESSEQKNRSASQHQPFNYASSLSEYSYSHRELEGDKIKLAQARQNKRGDSLSNEVDQSKPWSLEDLPVEGIKKRYRIRDNQFYYQLDMSKRKELYPILLHQHYIKQYWNDHLQRFNASLSSQCIE